MKRQIGIAFAIALFCLTAALFVGFGGADGAHAVGRALLIPLLALVSVLYVLKRRRPGRRGLMNGDKRPPLTPDERNGMTDHFLIFALSTKIQADNMTPIARPLSDEVARLTKLWKVQSGGKPLSDDEIRSLDILTRIVVPVSKERAPNPERDKVVLNGVADPDYFFALRDKVVAWEATQPKVTA